jgi:hypothetical protein
MSPFGFVTGDSKSLPSVTVRSSLNVGSERPKPEDYMIARRLVQLTFRWRTILLMLLAMSSVACSTVQEATRLAIWNQQADETIRLTDAEQMVDELDRILTAYGTISVKTPDVWGQDRLAKFRSEYEAQMAEWLKHGFKGEINASVRRAESESRLVQVGASLGSPSTKPATTPPDDTASSNAISKNLATLSSTSQASSPTIEKAPVSLEPTVVLDEHSSYLNHLNQLRRINAGDELADRPGYGLYLVRIPVTLSPGPRSRKGKGAIITVSAKSVMTKSTLRNALRNTVINETVNNLTQAIRNQSIEDDDRTSGRGNGSFSLVSYADTELFYGRPNIELLGKEAEHQLSKDLHNEPHHRTARMVEAGAGSVLPVPRASSDAQSVGRPQRNHRSSGGAWQSRGAARFRPDRPGAA